MLLDWLFKSFFLPRV
jgi:hypothetical protein